MKILKRGKLLVFCALLCLLFATVASAAGSGDVASAVESTWTTASTQIKTVVDNKRPLPHLSDMLSQWCLHHRLSCHLDI